MLSEIQALSDSENFAIVLENEPEKTRYWFRATEVCNLLFSRNNSQKYVKLHCKDWQYREFQTGKGRPALYVCESGVYRLILRSKAPIAIEFQDWLTEELLPKLRIRGGVILDQNQYVSTASSEELESLKSMIEVERQQRILLEEENDRLKKTIEATPVLARAEATKTQMEVIALIHIEIDRHSVDCANDQQYKISLLYHNYCQDLVRYIEDGFPPAVGLKYLDLANDTFEATFEPIRKSHAPWNFTSRWRTLEVETSEYYKKFLAEQAKASKAAKAA